MGARHLLEKIAKVKMELVSGNEIEDITTSDTTHRLGSKLPILRQYQALQTLLQGLPKSKFPQPRCPWHQ